MPITRKIALLIAGTAWLYLLTFSFLVALSYFDQKFKGFITFIQIMFFAMPFAVWAILSKPRKLAQYFELNINLLGILALMAIVENNVEGGAFGAIGIWIVCGAGMLQFWLSQRMR